MHACAQLHLKSEVLTIGRASSRGTPITFILPPLVLRSRILAKCFCRHLRSWALQGLKLLLGWSPSSLSAIRPRWGEVSTRKGQGSIPPTFCFLDFLQPSSREKQGVQRQEKKKATPWFPAHSPGSPQANIPLEVLDLSLTPPSPALR